MGEFMKNILLTISLLLLVTNSAVISQTPSDLLPGENEITGWTFVSDSCNSGLANDCTSLYDAIDGGADVYVDRGFVSGAYKGYTDGVHCICVEVFDQGTYENALSVYQYYGEFGGYEPISDIGDSAHIDKSLMYEYVIELVNGKFFIRLDCLKDDIYKPIMLNMTQKIDRKLPIKNEPTITNSSNSRLGKISIYPSNGNYLFKTTLSKYFTDRARIPEVSIYNLKGLLIQKLALKSFGTHSYITHWDGKNKTNVSVAKGQYTAILRKENVLIRKNFLVGY